MQVINQQGETVEIDTGYRFGEAFFSLLDFIKVPTPQDAQRNSFQAQCDLFYRDIMNYDFVDSHNQHMADKRFDLAAKNLNALHNMSIDPLTGLRKKEFLQRKQISLENQIYYEQIDDFALIMCDLDKFKSINDGYGHSTGDDTLALFGQLLLSSIRPCDFAYRYGGEEFLILLPDTCLADAVSVAERIRFTVEQRLHLGHYGLNQITAFDITKKQIADEAESGALDAFFLEKDITCSFGVANYDAVGASSDLLFSQADENLYTAKNSGRNKVVG